DVLEPEADALEHDLQIFDNTPRLRLDTLGQRCIGRGRIGRHLPGHEHEAIGLDGMRERRDGARARGDEMMDRQGHGAHFPEIRSLSLGAELPTLNVALRHSTRLPHGSFPIETGKTTSLADRAPRGWSATAPGRPHSGRFP